MTFYYWIMLICNAFLIATGLFIINRINIRAATQQLELLSVLVNVKDPYTFGHQEHVTALIHEFYDHLPCKWRKQVRKEYLFRAALIHDIGKLFVDDQILNKPGKLTEEEFNQIKLHASIGAKIVAKTRLSGLSPLIAYHHERIDGKGYFNLIDDDIPIEAKMIAICDTFSAITTERPYSKGHNIKTAIEMLKEASGTQLDKELVDCFVTIGVETFARLDKLHKGRYH